MKKPVLNPIHLRLFVFLLCLFAVVCTMILFDAVSYRLPVFDGTVKFEEPGWYFGEKGTVLQPTQLGDQHWIEPGKTYILTTQLVYNGDGDDYPCAMFTMGNYESRVYLDGEEMFRYTKQERGFPQISSTGGAAFSVPLGKNCQGKVLTIELNTPMDYASLRRMPGVVLGDHAANVHHLFFHNLPSMIISMAIFFVTLILVLLGNASARKRWAYLHFAVFALIIVAYRSAQDLFIMYLWASPMVSVTMEFFALVVCPLPILLSYRSELKPRFETTFNFLIAFTAFDILLQLVLHFTGLVDVVQMLTLTHIWVGICAAIVIYIGCKVHREDPGNHCMRKLIPILIGAALDFAAFYIKWHTVGAGSFFVVGNFIGIGLLVSLSMLVWEARKEREHAQLESERNQILERVAYEDGLTGIANRAAFSKAIDRIGTSGEDPRKIRVVMADLNDLKLANDTLGHAAGDELICQAANLLRDSFQKYGTVFRTGGDEFCALLQDVSDAQWVQLRSKLYQRQEQINQGRTCPLSIAMGTVLAERSVEKALQAADRLMYQDKVRIKSGRQAPSYPAGELK